MKRIFLVDDSKVFRFTVKKMFQFFGYDGELLEFENGILALDKLIELKDDSSKMPDLILLDINMPEKNGFELLDALKLLEAPLNNLKVKMLSSSIDPIDIAKADTYTQVIGFLTKPLNPVMVKEIIEDL